MSALELALEQLPQEALRFAFACRETRIRFSLGFLIDAQVREAILTLPERAFKPAINGDGEPRDGAWVAELTGAVNLESWPGGHAADLPQRAPAPPARS